MCLRTRIGSKISKVSFWARYVIDAGTRHEKTVTAGKEILFKGTVPTNTPPTQWDGQPFIVPVSLSSIRSPFVVTALRVTPASSR
jgi:hypothetical protein